MIAFDDITEETYDKYMAVNAKGPFSPGWTDTDMLHRANPGETFEQEVELTPLKRLGQPRDIASIVAFLAGPDGGWINGQNIRADGGVLA